MYKYQLSDNLIIRKEIFPANKFFLYSVDNKRLKIINQPVLRIMNLMKRPQTIGEIVEKTKRTKSEITKLLGIMVKEKFIKKYEKK